jgi:DNA-directed RNA polymerase specialized sigma24 family protein
VASRRDDDTETVVIALYPALRRFAAMVAPLELDPDDLVQDALAATLARKSLSDLDDPLAYLRLVMVRRAANERRRLGRKRRADQRAGAPPEMTSVTYPSDLAELARLSPDDRALIYLTEVEGRAITEVAELFGRSAAALKMRRRRALRRLRTLLEEEAHG